MARAGSDTVTDAVAWLVDADDWTAGAVFARGPSPKELAVRRGAGPGGSTGPVTDAEVRQLGITAHRPAADGDGVVRVGGSGDRAFALEHGDSTGGDLPEEMSRDGVEIVRYVPVQEHPPADFPYARDGAPVSGYGLTEEVWRRCAEPDLLLPGPVAAGVLSGDGSTGPPPEHEDHRAGCRRSPGVVERRFGPSLSPACLQDARLPACAVRGTPRMTLSR